MSEPTTELVPAPTEVNGDMTDERLRRIEAAVMVLAAQQAAGPPPEGYQPPRQSSSGALVPMSLAVQAAQASGYLPGGETVRRRRWIDWPVIREIRLVSRMYVDPRYSPTRFAQLGVPILLGFLVLNYLFWRGWLDWTFVSPVFERLIVMVVAVLLYRILSAEMTRYAAVLDYLERSGRSSSAI
jgi:hypothetical protein